MKKSIRTLAFVLGICLIAVAWASAQSHDAREPGSMDHSGHAVEEAGEMDHGSHDTGHGQGMGETIHRSTVDGHALIYHLIDMRETMEGMEGMPAMKATHHLMVFVNDPRGNRVERAKAGFLIENPDGSEQRAMTMAMDGGHGADIALDGPGVHIVKTKVVADGITLMDRFEYEAE
jgi:hypothetical protein